METNIETNQRALAIASLQLSCKLLEALDRAGILQSEQTMWVRDAAIESCRRQVTDKAIGESAAQVIETLMPRHDVPPGELQA